MSAPAVVFGLYFALVFALGWVSLRRTRSEGDYWIAGGSLGWLVGGATLAATHTSAGTFIGTIGIMHGSGWSFGWLVLSIPLAYWFMAAVLAPRFTRVRELTLPAFLERRYGTRRIRALGAVIILVATVVYVQAQIVAGGLVAGAVFGIPEEVGMVAFTVVLLVYTTIGGMLAVAYTDLLQLVVMAAGVALALPVAIGHVGGLDALFAAVQGVNPGTFEWGAFPASALFTMGIAFMLGSASSPAQLVRLYAMRDMRTIRRGVLFAVLLITAINLMVFMLALVSPVLFPALPTGDLAMPMLARTLLPPVLAAIMLAALTSAMMSTVDSLLLVAGSALSHDIYGSLRPSGSQRTALWLGRLGIVVVGIAPVLLLLSGVGRGELVQFIVLLFTALMASSFFVPVVAGVFWARAAEPAAVAAMLGGLGATFAWKLWGSEVVDPVLPGFLTSLVLMVTVSLAMAPPPGDPLAPYRPAGPRGAAGTTDRPPYSGA
ncbi:MAG: hypothetical protein D6701_09685 [Gemmatimonadetes bacterium]|nr:MAG: hypothetical protein D6701_09685 [Gemmatimonadota bacterium]